MFITVEGVEGTGKSTLAASLVSYLEALGRSVTATREPGGTPVGDRLRAIFLDPALRVRPLTEAMIVNAARAELVESVIRPALAAGQIVICDRYVDATYAYQGYGRRIAISMLRQACEMATKGLEPDLTLLLDLEPSLGLARRHGAKLDRMESEDLDFHRRVRAGYLELASREPRFRLIDAAQSAEAVLAIALRHVDASC
jgi:dTMP kinase